MDYYKKYKKYKNKYKMARTFEYLNNLNVYEVKLYQINILKKYFDNFDELNVIEFGIGNGARSIKLSELFGTYIGVEPNETLFNLAKTNCKKNNCNIKIFNDTIENYNSNDKYDIIILINTFHFINNKDLLQVIRDNLNHDGIVYIEEPKPIPRGWGSDSLNKVSPSFSKKLWTAKKTKLIKKRNYLLNNIQKHNLHTDFYNIHKNIFVIKKSIP